jgi:hypothetical protein
MFGLPQENSLESTGDSVPLVLPELEVGDFRAFTKAALARCDIHLGSFARRPILLTHSILSAIDATARLSVPEWGAVLVLADKWALDSLRAYAIEHCSLLFSETTAARQLHLALRLTIPPWVHPAVERLVTRTTPLDAAEIDMLGSDSVAKILRVREQNMGLFSGRRSSSSQKYELSPIASHSIRASFPCGPEPAAVIDSDSD